MKKKRPCPYSQILGYADVLCNTFRESVGQTVQTIWEDHLGLLKLFFLFTFYRQKILIDQSTNNCLVWWQVYQLQTELQKVQMENKFQKQCSLRRASLAETPQLQEEVRRLQCQLVKAEKLDPVREMFIRIHVEQLQFSLVIFRRWKSQQPRVSLSPSVFARLVRTSWPRTWLRP